MPLSRVTEPPQSHHQEGRRPRRSVPNQLRPLFGSTSRFIGLVCVASVWVTLITHSSSELFPSTFDELLRGGLGSCETDFGLGGDYLGWGEAALEPHQDEFDFDEITDVIASLVEIWYAAAAVVPSWGESFAVDLGRDLGDDWSSHVSTSSVLFGADFLSLNFTYWMAVDGRPEPPRVLLARAKAEAKRAKAVREQRGLGPVRLLAGPARGLFERVAKRRVAHVVAVRIREERAQQKGHSGRGMDASQLSRKASSYSF